MNENLDTRKWRNAFYGLPASYDANAEKPQNLKVTDKILHEAAKRAKLIEKAKKASTP